MPRKSKYGLMPAALPWVAKVRGDAGVYRIWGVDWMQHRVLIDRAGLEWISIDKVALESAADGVDFSTSGGG